jgi:hypothetical protein
MRYANAVIRFKYLLRVQDGLCDYKALPGSYLLNAGEMVDIVLLIQSARGLPRRQFVARVK